MTHFRTAVTSTDDGITVTVAGECDLATRDELAAALAGALDRAATVTVDLGEVTFLDSSGLHVLIEAHHAAGRTGKRVYVTGAAGIVAEVLDLTGIGDLLRRPADGS